MAGAWKKSRMVEVDPGEVDAAMVRHGFGGVSEEGKAFDFLCVIRTTTSDHIDEDELVAEVRAAVPDAVTVLRMIKFMFPRLRSATVASAAQLACAACRVVAETLVGKETLYTEHAFFKLRNHAASFNKEVTSPNHEYVRVCVSVETELLETAIRWWRSRREKVIHNLYSDHGAQAELPPAAQHVRVRP